LRPVAAGIYRVRIKATGFSLMEGRGHRRASRRSRSRWTPVELGVEAIDSVVDAITVEDLAEQQITAEEHQRILGILAQLLTSTTTATRSHSHASQKFKLALVVSRDPITFGTTAITAGIEQAQGDLAGYGPGIAGYAQPLCSRLRRPPQRHLPRLGHLSVDVQARTRATSTTAAAAVMHRALYAISTVVICKGDNGKWQPNYSNVLGNVGAGALSSLYYPDSARHDFQTSVDNIFIGIGEGSFGTLFQEFLLRHVTHGIPRQQ
jgi:hypothetical protein